MQQEEEERKFKKTDSAYSSDGIKKVNFLNKSKYSFFNILSYAYSRAEAKLLLNRLS